MRSRLHTLASDPAAFRDALVIDCDGMPRPFRDVIEPWQRADFEALDPGLRAVVGQDVADCHLRHWWERSRGHSKTSDISIAITWLLFASRRPLRIAAAAADQDQAGLLRDAILRLTGANAWLKSVLDVQARRICNPHTGSICDIITSDAPSSYGLLLDAIVCDELCHWPKRDLWDSLLSTAAKRSRCLLLAITNAGFADSWQWQTREAIRSDAGWYFSRLDGPQATWITADRLAEQERLLPTIAYRRLWLNEWSSGSGDALSESDIVAAVDPDMSDQPARHEVCVAGLDLGLKHDASAFCIVAKSRAGQLRVLRVRRWQAPKNGKLNLAELEATILEDHREYRPRRVSCDPWQASYLLQRLRRAGVPTFERQQAGPRLVEQAMALVEAFTNGTIRIPPHELLLSELRRARVEERSYGVRLTSDRDATGHGDIVSALSIALAEVKQCAPQIFDMTGWQPPDDIVRHLVAEGATRYKPARSMSFLPRPRFGVTGV